MGWACPYRNLMRIISEVRQEQQERLDWLRDRHGDGTGLSPSPEGARAPQSGALPHEWTFVDPY